MRKFWLTFGWGSAIGSFLDGLILLFAIYIIFAVPSYTWALTSEVLFRDHIAWLYWIKQLAYLLMNKDAVNWIFGLPATVFFSIRIVASVAVGKWALNKAEALRPIEARANNVRDSV